MAFWRKDGTRVSVYTSRDGRQRRLPRDLTRHLDREPDHNIDTWVHNWALVNERTVAQAVVLTNQDVLTLVETFCTYLSTRKKSPKTISQHRHNLTRYCLPFLVQAEGLVDPVQWPTRSVRLLEHLQGRGVAARTINTCNVSMRVFWNWLVEEGRATGTLLVRNAIVGAQATPLGFTVTPDDIIKRLYPSPELRLLALIGYFFSLRPQELVSLRPCDFRAGSIAAELDACKAAAKHHLFGRFAVNITRQRVGQEFKTPKANSKGWVACFHEVAAREIVASLQRRKPDELLFSHRLDWWFRLWARDGYPGLALKDLRRASLYWLGHFTELPFTALKNHARHADPSTTALYTRRPGQDAPAFDALDLDA